MTVREGQQVGEYRVVKIEGKSISLEKDGQTYVLGLFAEGKISPPAPHAPVAPPPAQPAPQGAPPGQQPPPGVHAGGQPPPGVVQQPIPPPPGVQGTPDETPPPEEEMDNSGE
jgi:hypothetical protein